jgi:hypothetical protein
VYDAVNSIHALNDMYLAEAKLLSSQQAQPDSLCLLPNASRIPPAILRLMKPELDAALYHSVIANDSDEHPCPCSFRRIYGLPCRHELIALPDLSAFDLHSPQLSWYGECMGTRP